MTFIVSEDLTYSKCKKLSLLRFSEAEILLEKRRYSGAYFLAGYAIELAVKGFYCKRVKRFSFPPNPTIVKNLYSHDINNLLSISGMKVEYDKDIVVNTSLQEAWGIIKDWNGMGRYSIIKKSDAKTFINCVGEVLKWIQTKW